MYTYRSLYGAIGYRYPSWPNSHLTEHPPTNVPVVIIVMIGDDEASTIGQTTQQANSVYEARSLLILSG